MAKRFATTTAPGRNAPAVMPAAGTGGRARRVRALRAALGPVFLVALTLAAHWPVLHAGFIWDDDYWLENNPVAWAGQAPQGYWFGGKTADYLPLTSTFFWLQYELWGNSPAGYHAVDLALHALVALGLWRVLRRLEIPGAYLAALVFAVHPVTVASSGWVAEQKNTLSTAVILACLLAWLRFDGGGRRGWYAAALGLAGAALLTKASAVILPGLLLGCAWWRRGRLTLRDLARSLPFWALVLVSAGVTVSYHRAAMAEGVDLPAGLVERAVLASRALWFYLGKALLPVGQSMIYPRWDVHTITPAGALGAAALLAAMAVLLVFSRRRWARPLTLGLGYYFVALLPVLGLVDTPFMMHSFVADHWHYLALPGPIALVVGLAWHALAPRPRAVRAAGLAVAAAGLAVLSVLTNLEARVYRGPIPLWQDTLAANPKALAAHTNLAAALVGTGQYEQAMQHYQAALALKPDQASTYNNIGLLHAKQEQYAQAVQSYRRALAINPRYADAHANLAVALAHLKEFEQSAHHFGESIRHRFVEDPPRKIAERHDGLGSALVELGRLEEALGHYSQALQLVPNHPGAIANRQVALHKLALEHATAGRTGEAVACFERALEAAPQDAELWLAQGDVLLRAGRLEEAARCLARLEQLQPGRAQHHFELGRQAAGAGRNREAAELYRKAVLGREGFWAALNNLAWLLATDEDASLRDGPAAVAYARQACDRAPENQQATVRLCLSAAYAEAGRRDEAVSAAREAQELEQRAGRKERAELLARLIDFYQAGRTYRDFNRTVQQPASATRPVEAAP